MSRVQGVYIPQIDGKDLWLSNYSGVGDSYSCKDKNDNINIKRYKAVFDYSLDLIKLREVYYKAYRNNKFSYIEQSCGNIKEYCNKIINVTFEYSVKEFNRTGDNVYLKIGNKLEDIQWEDCVGYNKRHEFIAVKVNVPVLNPINDLDKAFKLEKNKKEELCYQAKTNIKCVTNVDNIRKKLYKNGFNIDGIHYIRWKRSSGSARVGKCLFIDEKLYSRMHIWEMCGLEIYTGDKVDLAAIQSYISLTSSSIIGTINLKPENILVVDDYESVFNDDCINVTEENGFLQAKHENVQICNSIWDGQSIIDPSAMGEYSDKGMILLRNRFFKSCAFNGNVQQWFKDNGITEVSQLNGKTRAKHISDIKLITTPNSIKYLKFGSLDQWLDVLESTFGVVKYEKPTHFMDGKLVQTHYQLLNSIQLSKEEMQEFLQPTFDFMTLLKSNPSVLRYWIKYQLEEEIEMTSVQSKTDVIYKMMSVNNDFYKTKLYYDFKKDFMWSFSKSLKCGHVLVNGNYSVLCGNPIEMLKQSIGSFDGNAVVEKECIYSTRFDWDKDILGSRSPHITASNVLLTRNKYNEDINTYMNSTDGIVYVNSINENLLQRLAGADWNLGLLM